MRDLDLGLIMPNIELAQAIFKYYNVFKFHVPRSISSGVIIQKRAHKHTKNTHTNKTPTDSDEYSIVAFCKNKNYIVRTKHKTDNEP